MSIFGKKMQEPYTIVRNEAESEAEVNLYGEVVRSRPVDFWTGEKVDGLYIVEQEFLDDIERLNTLSRVTFRINSVGGDADAGIAIYNRIREMGAKTTTIVDGLAASAASIIFMAGDNRKMGVGTQIMIHGTSVGIAGYYNAEDIKKIQKMLDSYDNALADIYAERTENGIESIRRMLKTTEWMTAEKAVEKGFASEITGDKEPKIEKADDKGEILIVNGIRHRMAAPAFAGMEAMNRPENIQILNGKKEPSEINIPKKEEKAMNLEELKASNPDLVEAIKAEAVRAARTDGEETAKAAVEAERSRLKEIEAIEDKIADKELVKQAKYGENPMDARELAFQALKAEDVAGASFMEALRNDVEASGVKNVSVVPNDGYKPKDGTEEQQEAVKALQAAFGE